MIDDKTLNKLTEEIIGAAIEVHRHLGPGMLESTYEACLEYELAQAGFQVERQKTVFVIYKGIRIDQGYRIDLVVNDFVLIELKSIEQLLPVHHAQVLTYLKHSGIPVGLLFNFNVKILKDGGIKRFIM